MKLKVERESVSEIFDQKRLECNKTEQKEGFKEETVCEREC